MNENFDDLEEKNTNNFALVFGVFVVSAVFAFIFLIAIFGMKEKMAQRVKVDDKPKQEVQVQSSKAAVSNFETKKTDSLGLFRDYMPKMQNKIKSNWNPPKNKTSSSITLGFEIKKDGSLGEIKIQKSSGDEQADKMAIEALKKSVPFEPLPEGFEGDKIDVQFTFDYNVYQK